MKIRITGAFVLFSFTLLSIAFAKSPDKMPGSQEYQFFSVEEANELLPEIEKCMNELKRLKATEAKIIQEKNAQSKGNGNVKLNAEKLLIDLDNLEQNKKFVSKLIGQLKDKGVIIRHMKVGLVDFPHLRDGRVVFLCWQAGENKIRYWHEIDGGKAGRKPLFI